MYLLTLFAVTTTIYQQEQFVAQCNTQSSTNNTRTFTLRNLHNKICLTGGEQPTNRNEPTPAKMGSWTQSTNAHTHAYTNNNNDKSHTLHSKITNNFHHVRIVKNNFSTKFNCYCCWEYIQGQFADMRIFVWGGLKMYMKVGWSKKKNPTICVVM